MLRQVKVAEKSNEIIAIPNILEMLEIEGAVINIDAMGYQRGIAQRILGKKADFILALKGNQSGLEEDVKVLVAAQKANGFKDGKIRASRKVAAWDDEYLASLIVA